MWTLAAQNSDELIYIWSFEPLEKCTTFEDIFPWLSRTISFNFQDFPRPKWFSGTFQVLEFSRRKIRDFPGGVGTLLIVLAVHRKAADRPWSCERWCGSESELARCRNASKKTLNLLTLDDALDAALLLPPGDIGAPPFPPFPPRPGVIPALSVTSVRFSPWLLHLDQPMHQVYSQGQRSQRIRDPFELTSPTSYVG